MQQETMTTNTQMNTKAECWKSAVSEVSDEMRLLANAPDNPWYN